MNIESISKSIAQKQRATADKGCPYEEVVRHIVTSPETCVYVETVGHEGEKRFTARTADKPLSKDLRRYLENSIKEFLEFRRDKLGHKTGDIDAEIIRLKTSIFGTPRHEEEAYNTEKEAESLKRYQELAMIMCCNRSSAAAALDYINTPLANGVDVNARLEDGTTALYMACQNGRKDIAELLLDKGANPNLARTYDGVTPLYVAHQKGHKDIAALLLGKGADPNLAMTDGSTPLHMACWKGHKDMAELLLANRADPNLAMTNGSTPLHMACQNGHKDIAELLLANRANPNLAMTNGATPLYMACQNGHKDIAELLLANVVNIIAGLYNSFTPLMVAAVLGHEEVVQLLLNTIEGTDTLTRTADTNKAEEFCKSRNITMPDSYRAFLGKTAMEMAKTPEIAKMIEDRTSELKAQERFVEGRYTGMIRQRQRYTALLTPSNLIRVC